MHATGDFRRGLKILVDGEPYEITDFQHVKPGKGNQFTRTKLRNLLTGTNLERTFKSGEKFGVPDVNYQKVQYLYKEGDQYHFMNQANYEQLSVNRAALGNNAFYIKENDEVTMLFYNDRAISIDVPKSVVLKVTNTEPGFKGNTVSGTTKPATLETGIIVQVPLHISIGDNLKVNTESGEYVERVNK